MEPEGGGCWLMFCVCGVVVVRCKLVVCSVGDARALVCRTLQCIIGIESKQAVADSYKPVEFGLNVSNARDGRRPPQTLGISEFSESRWRVSFSLKMLSHLQNL